MLFPVDSIVPIDLLDFGFDWTDFLDGDVITSVTIVLCADDTSGVTISTPTHNAVLSWCDVTGGTPGQTAKVEHTITFGPNNYTKTDVLLIPIGDIC